MTASKKSSEKIAVIGLGYVGLPLALALEKKFETVVGFDISATRVQALKDGIDVTDEADEADLKSTTLTFTAQLEDIADCTFFIVTVPTPIEKNKRPDLTPVKKASESVGSILKKGALVVYESTVYPGLTEEVCGPILEARSGLKCGSDFNLGYSPERINPGDKVNRLETIVKVVAADSDGALKRVVDVYDSIIDAGLHVAPNIKTAEACKVIENTQRDLNISLMNELALIFDRMGIRTHDVLQAAGTKWNFLKFSPGLVGGHCIGVDPYYLTTKAQEVGYEPQVILSGRTVNEKMGRYIARKTIKLLAQQDRHITGARVAVLGLTFKENVPDIRNSRVPDVIGELKDYGVNVLIHDPHADADEVKAEYGLDLVGADQLKDLDAVILAVGHQRYLENTHLAPQGLSKGGVIIDVKSLLNPDDFKDYTYWSL